MNREELRETLTELRAIGLSQRNIADLFGYGSHSTIYQWQTGATTIPDDVARFLRSLRQWWRNNAPSRSP